MTDYSSKSTALRGAKRAGMENPVAYLNAQGRWEVSDGGEVLGKADDFEMSDAELNKQLVRAEVVADTVDPLTVIKTPGDVANADLEKLAAALGPRKDSTPDEIKARREARKAQPKADKPKVERVKKDATGKVPSYKELARMAPEKSKIDKPVSVVRAYLATHYGTQTRKEIVAHLVGLGLNLAMCRAQYQMYRNKLKLEAETKPE